MKSSVFTKSWATLVLSIFALAGYHPGSAKAAYAPPSGTVAFYQFDNSGNLGQDSSASSNDLVTATGTPAFSASGQFGGALSLDGVSTLDKGGVFPTGVPVGSSSYTIALWIKDTGGSAIDSGFVGWGATFGGQANNLRYSGNTQLDNYWWAQDTVTPVLATNFWDGQWHHIAVTFNNPTATTKIYVDGVVVVTDSARGVPNVTAANFVVGKTIAATGIHGLMDDLLIANRALAGAEIIGVMNEAPPVTDNTNVSVATVDSTAVESPTLPNAGLYNITRTGDFGDLVVKVSLSGTATVGSDYADPTGGANTVTIPNGTSGVNVYITPVDDANPEAAETVSLDIVADVSYTRGATTNGIITVYDDDAVTSSVSVVDATASEAAVVSDVAVYRVSHNFTLTFPTSIPITMSSTAVSGVSGAAVEGVDYVTIGTSVTIPAGTDGVLVYLTPIDDNVAEIDEVVKLTVNNSTGLASPPVTASGSPASATIIDDDTPVISLFQTDNLATEGSTDTAKFQMSRVGNTLTNITVRLSIYGTAVMGVGNDYTAFTAANNYVIPAGTLNSYIIITPLDDTTAEYDETASISIAGNTDLAKNAQFANANSLAIKNRTDSFKAGDILSIAGVTGLYTVNSTLLTGGVLTVTFTPGLANAVVADALITNTNPSYNVNGSVNTDTITIIDNDLPKVSIAALSSIAVEGGASASFRITHIGNTLNTITVLLNTSGTAVAGTDYVTAPVSVVIPVGTTGANFSLAAINDAATGEVDKSGNINLTTTGITGYTVDANSKTAVITVVDNDPTVVIASNANVNEGAVNSSFKITRTGGVSATDLTVYFSVLTTDQVKTTAKAGATAITVKNSLNSFAAADTISIAGVAGTYTVISTSTVSGSLVLTITPALPGIPNTDVAIANAVITNLNTATQNVDYTLVASFVHMAVGSAEGYILVTPIEDVTVERDEAIHLAITPNAAYSLAAFGSDQATMRVIDNETNVVTISATDAISTEGGTNYGTFTVSRNGSTATVLSVMFTFAGSTAKTPEQAGGLNDFTQSPMVAGIGLYTLGIPAGQGSANVTIVPILDTLLNEGDETVVLTIISNIASYNRNVIGTDDTATVVISDTQIVGVTALDPTATEAVTVTDSGSFLISRSGGVNDSTLTVSFGFTGTATYGTDYPQIPLTAVIPAGTDNVVVLVTPLNDALGEDDESVILTLKTSTSYGVDGNNSTAQVGIHDDNNDTPVITLSVITPTVVESSGGFAQFKVHRAGTATFDVTVNLAVGGTATSGVDYTAIPTTLLIPAGQNDVFINVAPIDDAISEVDENVSIGIGNSPNGSYLPGLVTTGSVLILDNEPPAVSVIGADLTATENSIDNTFGYRFSRTGSTTASLVVQLSVSGTAVAGTDYITAPTSVTIPAGTAGVILTLTVLDDTYGENDETVIMEVKTDGAYSRGTLVSSTATILDDGVDPSVIDVAVINTSANEAGGSVGQFRLNRVGYRTGALTVLLALTGTATNGTDYVTIPTTVVMPNLAAAVNIYVTAISDLAAEGDETVILTLVTDSHYLNGATITGTVTVVDKASVSVAKISDAGEPSTVGLFRVSRGTSVSSSLAITLTTTGTASSAKDYVALPLTATIPGGTDSVLIYVTPIDDIIPEGTETVVLSIVSNVAKYNGTGSASMDLTDNDNTAVVTVAATTATVAESTGTGVFTITRTGGVLTSPLTVKYAIGGSASAGIALPSDYVAVGTQVVIAANATTATILVTPFNDTVVENNETVVLTLGTIAGSATNYLVAAPAGPGVTAISVNNGLGTFLVGDTISIGLATYTVTSNLTGSGTLNIAAPGLTAGITIGTKVQVVYPYYTSTTGYTATVTILDDELPIVSVIASDSTASEPGVNTGAIQFARQGSIAAPLQVFFSVSGTATSGTDYTSIGTSAVIAAGSTTCTVYITPINDANGEVDETVIVTLTTDVTYTRASQNTASVLILDDNDAVSVSISATDATAAELGLDTGKFVITRAGSTLANLTVNLNITGTATNGTDYATLPAFVVIGAGQTTASLTVTAITDVTNEGDETVILTIAAAATYIPSVSAGTATVTIVEAPTINASVAANAAEPATNGKFRLTRTGNTGSSITVNYAITGTASRNFDYTMVTPDAVSIPAGTNGVLVTVSVKDDALGEYTETVILTVSASSIYNVGTATATMNLTDDTDTPALVITAVDATADENGDTGTFAINRTGLTTNALTVIVNIAGNAVMGTDYTAIGTSLGNAVYSVVIPAGTSGLNLVVAPINDTAVEGNETVVVTFATSATYSFASGSASSFATVTILDNAKNTISVIATDAISNETAGDTAKFTLTRAGDFSAALVVNYALTGTATNGSDYQTLSGTVTIAAGTTKADVIVTPIDDVTSEGTETVILTVTPAVTYSLSPIAAQYTASATILDNDLPTITIAATDSVSEEPGTPLNNGTFTITRVGTTSSALTVFYTVSGSATGGSDYNLLTGSAVIPVNTLTVNVTVTPLDDSNTDSGNETVTLTLSTAATYFLGGGTSASVTIFDKQTVTVTSADTDASEPGLDTGSFTFTRSGGLQSGALTVSFAISGTASLGNDFVNPGLTAVIPGGQSTVTVIVTAINDQLGENDETVIVTINATNNYLVGVANTATVTIHDDGDDSGVAVTAPVNTITEGSGVGGLFRVTRTGSTAADLSILMVRGGTATLGSDYFEFEPGVLLATPGAGSYFNLVIPSGTTGVLIRVTSIDDNIGENDEYLTITAQASAGYTVSATKTATINFIDNDSATIVVQAADAIATEVTPFNLSVTTVSGSPTVTAPNVNGVVVGAIITGTGIPANTTVINLVSATSFTLSANATASGTVTAGVLVRDDGLFAISRTGSTTSALVVDFAITGTATDGSDYSSLPASVTIQAGSTTAYLTVTVIDDVTVENDETVILTINTSGAGYNRSATGYNATVKIRDNEQNTATVTASDPLAQEPGVNKGAFTVTRVGNTTLALTVTYAVSGSATAGTSYVALNGTAVIPALSSFVVVTVTPLDDTTDSNDTTVIATLNASGSYTVTGGAATVTIQNNDHPTIVSQPTATPAAQVFGQLVALSAMVTDDNRPVPASLKYTWSLVSSTTGGNVQFNINGTSAAANVNASFSLVGTYVIRMSVTDGTQTSTTGDVGQPADITVIIVP